MEPFLVDHDFTLYVGDVRDVLRDLPDESVHCVVTSPPYWGLRDYGAKGQLGVEPTPDEYVSNMVDVFREVRRILRSDGTCWTNLGDSYNAGRNGGWAGGKRALNEGRDIDSIYQSRSGANVSNLKPKDLIGIPWRFAFALQADGWYLRSDVIWSKPNPMPESVTDRPTNSHEHLFLLSKSPHYFYDHEAIKEPVNEEWVGHWKRNGATPIRSNPDSPYRTQSDGLKTNAGIGFKLNEDGSVAGRNKRNVWEITTEPTRGAHFATFPQALVEPCIKAGCPEGGTVLDPFMGSGTTALVARRLGRNSIGIELNEKYAKLCAERLQQLSLLA